MIYIFSSSNEHMNLLSSFGLSEDSNFPTAAFVPAKANNDDMVIKTSCIAKHSKLSAVLTMQTSKLSNFF